MLPDGTYAIGVSQLAEIFQFPKKNANRDIKALLGKALLGEDFQFLKVYSELSPKPVNALSVKDAEILIGVMNSRKTQKNKDTEKRVQNTLCRKVNGTKEIVVPAGRIDILTSTHLVEVKHSKKWKEGVGQLMIYGAYYPSHSLWLHIYASHLVHHDVLEMIEFHCSRLGIKLTYE
jgi:hypothetical protein